MKRGGPLARGNSFKPHTAGLARRGALLRQSAMTRTAVVKAKRPTVTAAERNARKAVRERSGDRCEVCGRAPMSNWHHRVNKGQGGAWTPENGLAVCGTGSMGCHGRITTSPALAYERGWSVRSTDDPALCPVWLAGRGWHHLTADGGTTPVPTGRSAA